MMKVGAHIAVGACLLIQGSASSSGPIVIGPVTLPTVEEAKTIPAALKAWLKAPTDDEQKCSGSGGVALPPRTVPKIPGMPEIPPAVAAILKKGKVSVDTSYYIDFNTFKIECATPKTMAKAEAGGFKAYLTHWAEGAIGTIIAALIYKSMVSNKRADFQTDEKFMEKHHGFHTSLCGCLASPSICICAFCCLPIRVADTVSAIGKCSFWPVLIIMLLIDVGSSYADHQMLIKNPAQESQKKQIQAFLYITIMAVWPGWRESVRAKLGGSRGCCAILTDILVWSCCVPCAAAQEAREVDLAQGAHMSSCCSIANKGGPVPAGEVAMVGQPVGVK